MKKLLPLNIATYGIIIILSAVIIFHLLVMVGIIPFDIVWGGRITDRNQLLVMESVSIVLNMLMLAVVLTYTGFLKMNVNPNVLKIFFWVMFLLFLLNTIGNLASKNNLETYIFTPLTLLLSIFCFKIAVYGFPKDKISINNIAA